METQMSSRERFAWVFLVLLVVSYGTYFTAVAVLDARGELTFWSQIIMLTASAVFQGVVLGVSAIVGRMRRAPGERTGPDERDRAIAHRSASVAYYVLMGGMILVGCIMPFGASGWKVANAAILAIVIAELVHTGLTVSGYRRGLRA
ncbi:hypothetical protein VZQ01_28705 [Myxococcus faecalis]|uniref:hypothetical protein n=1 Tax=Myxococcus faecalis TaxID=3115646 RepID=UPI0024C921A1|nr:hypothetical protein MFMH1_67140 [Myxococcus sp. MH1]